MSMSNPLFVAISDIHFNINNLELATIALEHSLNKAKELHVPLVIAGDLHDTKAILRGEVMNRLWAIFNQHGSVTVYALVGNHDLLNEKGEEHGLTYLNGIENVMTIKVPLNLIFNGQDVHFIPYQNSTEKFKTALNETPEDALVVCHQGVQGAYMGDYAQDKTSIKAEAFGKRKLISGHYHRHQSIGGFAYIGSPFTHTYGEANDGDKGYLIVKEDGSFERVILKLRKHVKIEVILSELSPNSVIYKGVYDVMSLKSNDLLWFKVTGNKSELNKINKEALGKFLLGHSNYKLDKIPDDSEILDSKELAKLEPNEVLDALIDAVKESSTQKDKLKSLYRSLL